MMIKKYSYICLLLIGVFFIPEKASAQVYGNEWIVPTQQYYKLKTAVDGMYQVTLADFQAANVPIDSKDPRNIQLWHRGVEQNIYIRGEGDGTFGAGDVLYFYGKMNDGTLDSLLYAPDPSQPGRTYQPHKYYNLHNDTAAYFLTWGSSPSTHRMTQDNTIASTPQEPYHIEENLVVLTDNFWRGRMYGESTESYGDQAEGWFGPTFSSTYTYPISISNVNSAGPRPILEIMIIGMNSTPSRGIDLTLSGNSPIPDTTFNLPVTNKLDGQGVQTFYLPFSYNYMTAANLTVTVIAKGSGNSIAVAYMKLRYAQNIDMNGAQQKYINLANPGSPSFIQLPWSSASQPVVYDITDKNNIRISNSSLLSGSLSAAFPAGTSKVLISSNVNFLSVPSIKEANLKFDTTRADFLMISHKKLMTGAEHFRDYRASIPGGAHNVLLADVEDIFDQYGYGEFSPVGIKRFCSYQIDNNANAKYLFLIGKGLDISYFTINPFIFYRKNPLISINNPDPTFNVENLIPTAGSPASDVLYAMDNNYKTRLAVGRIFSKSSAEVDNYLNKVKEHETLDSNVLWRKNLIHLVGGQTYDQQQNFFLPYVNNYKSIVENSIFSGKVVKTYLKDFNSGTIDNQSMAEDVNNGLSYVTFYGHGSANVFDLDIGYVSNPLTGYTNKGKYPMLIVDGCYTAASFYSISLAEDWMNTADKGSILVLGSSDIGYTGTLDSYTSAFYIQNFNTKANIGKSIGEIQKIVINNNTDDITSMQMLLHGDPSIKIYSPHKADYEVSGTEVRADMPKLPATLNTYDGSKLTSATDSFYVNVPIKNFGIYDTVAFTVVVKRTANGKEVTYPGKKYSAIRYLQTIQYPIPSNDQSLYGLNKFEVYIDYTDTVHEMREDNNIATIQYYMPTSAVTCLFPAEYSIVHDQPVTFVAQSTDLLVQQSQYYIQYDTSYLFNSPYVKDTIISAGSLMKWPNRKLLNTDSTVYYWRVRFNDVPAGQDTLWSTSSFIYIHGSPDGWSQSEYAQFTKAKLQNVSLDVANQKWKFTNSSKGLYLKTYGNGNLDINDKTELAIQGVGLLMFAGYGYNDCGVGPGVPEISAHEFDGMLGMFFNKSSLDYYFPSTGAPLCGRVPKSIVSPFKGLYDPTAQAVFEDYLNKMQPGDFALLGSNGNSNVESWSASLKNLLKGPNFNAKLIDSLQNNMAYILLVQKGAATPLFEQYSKDKLNGSVSLSDTIKSVNNNGYIMSTIIGPASQWGTMYKKADSSANDKIIYKVIGIKANGDTATVLNNPPFHYSAFRGEDTLSLQGLIDPKVYSSLRLIAYVYDSVSLTPPQLRRWQVIYHSVPEGTMDPFRAGLPQYTVGTRDEGDKICLTYFYENISGLSFDDSLKVRITVTNPNIGTKDTVFIISADSLKPNQSVSFSYCFASKGYSGNNTIRAFVNPNDYGFQPEQYYNNNVIEVNFDVIKDLTAPVIDVVFDGVHIIDGDVVSPSPLINIVLTDNSKFLLINDPNDISIFLTRPNSKTVEQILPTDPSILRFGQTPGKANSFSIEYNPQNLPDGIYTLQVQGKDVNGNKSGHLYIITFEVINASTITNFYPYPNPFSSSTRFVFTLTGKFVPDDFKIQIMTISGKVVREIMKAELGNIHIGNNKTDYSWDGTDEYGDRLANGVYLYRVVIKNAGDNFQHRDTAGDKSFTKDFGKLVILR